MSDAADRSFPPECDALLRAATTEMERRREAMAVRLGPGCPDKRFGLDCFQRPDGLTSLDVVRFTEDGITPLTIPHPGAVFYEPIAAMVEIGQRRRILTGDAVDNPLRATAFPGVVVFADRHVISALRTRRRLFLPEALAPYRRNLRHYARHMPSDDTLVWTTDLTETAHGKARFLANGLRFGSNRKLDHLIDMSRARDEQGICAISIRREGPLAMMYRWRTAPPLHLPELIAWA